VNSKIANKIIFYAPQLAPHENSAAGVRCKAILKALSDEPQIQKSQVQIEVLTNENLYFKMPSNKLSFAMRFLKEAVIGLEVFVRLLTAKVSGSNPLVLISSPPYVACLIIAFSCQLLNLRYCLDIRDPYPEVYFNQNLFRRTSLLGQLQINLAKQFYNMSECIFTVTEGCRKIISAYLSPIHKPDIHVVRNGFVSEDFSQERQKSEEFTCVFHGNLGYLQNISLLKMVIKKAYLKDPAIQFVVAGHGPQEHLLQSIQTANFRFLGEVKNSQIPELLLRSHLGLSFRDEGGYSDIAFPVKIFEYIGAGLPVITTPVSEAVIELKEKQMGLLFSNTQVDEIVNAIYRLAHDPNEYLKLQQNVLRYRQDYSREAGARHLAEVFYKHFNA
jgi:glycosyltransferase involved in cell wall biosynthesis